MIGVAVLAAAAFAGGGAYAATQSNTDPRQAFLNDLAKRLNVTPAQLRDALKGALLDRLDAAVKAGVITQAQANRIERRLESGAPVPFFLGPRRFGLRGFGLHANGFGVRGTLGAAASYLGLSDAQLLSDLRSGQTLAQIAKARGKSVAGLQQAITAAIKARLDKAVAAGRITQAQENKILSRIGRGLDRPLLRLAPRLGGWGPGEGVAPGPPPGVAPGPPPGVAPGPPPGVAPGPPPGVALGQGAPPGPAFAPGPGAPPPPPGPVVIPLQPPPGPPPAA